ncbi:MAG: 4Fe-4S dicluster domain-containing protein [Ruminococcaceae bacterium]|nr:4Fe-4S dicluster domain-containing protein [Oscillospiraceae bacterium]
MDIYKHSVALDQSKCSGCTSCLKHCPTEAIRIKNGHAVINAQRCIDCGQCIRHCPHNAKKPVSGSIERMKDFKWNIALPAPALYGQFEELEDVDYVLSGLKAIGFDDVFEVAQAAEQVSGYTRLYLKNDMVSKPVISSACPAVVRLIGMRFPSLKDNIMPILPPMEIAAMQARKQAKEQHPELSDSDIGIFFISPCPAKVSYVHNEYGSRRSNVDEIIAISDIYFMLINVMKRENSPEPLSHSGKIGVGWASTGGEASAIFNDKYLAADGIENVIRVLDLIETGNMPQLEFIELCACPAGCVGGVMTVENPYIAQARLLTLRRYLPVTQNNIVDGPYIPDSFIENEMPVYQPISRLGSSIGESIRLMADIQRIREMLPGIDCGACGAPTCRAFAEDIVRGSGLSPEDCVILMRDRLCGCASGSAAGESEPEITEDENLK